MDFFNFRKKQIIKTPMATCEWEPVTKFDRLLTWMWGPPGCAKRKSEHIEPELMYSIFIYICFLSYVMYLLTKLYYHY